MPQQGLFCMRTGRRVARKQTAVVTGWIRTKSSGAGASREARRLGQGESNPHLLKPTLARGQDAWDQDKVAVPLSPG